MPRPFFDFVMHHVGGRCPHQPASAILHRTSCRGGRPCPPVPAAADKSKIDASLRASAHTCPASYRGVCRVRVPYAPGCRGNPVDFPGVSWDACRGRCRAQLFATKERYRCGLPLAGTHRPASAILHRAIVFECRGGRLCPPAKAPSASEEACCIPFPPGRRKLHIRSLLLPSQIVTVSLGHNLAIWNFTTPHAILMMADIFCQ